MVPCVPPLRMRRTNSGGCSPTLKRLRLSTGPSSTHTLQEKDKNLTAFPASFSNPGHLLMLDPFSRNVLSRSRAGCCLPEPMCQTLMFALAVLSQMQPETSAAPFQEKPGFLLAVVGTATHSFVPGCAKNTCREADGETKQ